MLTVVILAAGQGKRMRSQLPKVLHPVGGKPMLAHVIDTAKKLRADKIVVVHGHQAEQVKTAITDDSIVWCLQAEQLGTGHAVKQATEHIGADDQVLVLYGDVPLIREQTLSALLAKQNTQTVSLLTSELEDATGYGRILRDQANKVTAIVEEKDANDQQRAIREVNTGILSAHGSDLCAWLEKIKSDNEQDEYYLTDCIELAVKDERTVATLCLEDETEITGVNSRVQLAEVEYYYQFRERIRLMEAGVTLLDPDTVYIRGSVEVENDIVIEPNVTLVGTVSIAEGVTIGTNCVLINTQISAGTQIHANSHIQDSIIGKNCEIGPFARLRPQVVLSDKVKIGNFVELKKSNIGDGSKVSHLSYVGDSQMGERVNVGAGTIVCNYDGANKHQTKIGDDVFIGSDSQLVAPVEIGNGATIGAGSTVTRDAPAGKLTLARSKQKTIDDWVRPTKSKK